MKKLLIGISGGSGSGKTTLAKTIIKKIGKNKVLLLSMDRYYKGLSNLSTEEREKVNFDSPDAIDWPLFRKQIKQLLANKKIRAPRYSFVESTRIGYDIIESKDVIIVEGIFALYDKEVCNLMTARVFISTPADIRLIRRIKRDVIERKKDIESILERWQNFVKPSYELFIEPTARQAHIIIPEDPEGGMRETAIKIIKSLIKEFYVEKKK